MAVFNSLGSNYNFDFAIKSLFASNKPEHSEELIERLEKKFDGKATLVYKGREALELALGALDLPKDSEVAINGFTCFVLYEAVIKAGYQARFLDVYDCLNFNAETFAKAVKQFPKIKAVVVQNTLGLPLDIEGVEKVCKENKIVLIEDLAHSVGTKYEDGREAGTVGQAVILSFSQDKIIDGVSGGAVILKKTKKDFDLKKVSLWQQFLDRFYPIWTWKIRILYPFGIGKLYHFILKKLNLLSRPVEGDYYAGHKLPNWEAGLAEKSFEGLEADLEHRRKIAKVYSEKLDKKVLNKNCVNLVKYSSNLRFPIFIENRIEKNMLIDFLKKSGIYVSDVWYDAPIGPKRYLHQTSYQGECHRAEEVSEKILNLPTHKNISEEKALFISKKINKWLESA